MKKIVCSLLCGVSALSAHAQAGISKLQLETRVDYQREYLDGKADHDRSGFYGKNFILSLAGNIDEHFSFAYRQCLNKQHKDASFFDATNWVYLTYRPNDRWELSAGKQVVEIGGYEYAMNPLNIYFASEYWNNISCFQLGASVAYNFAGGRDRLVAQCTQSPYRANASDMYAYNLMWYGHHGRLSTTYSANLVEYMPGSYIGFVSLGHRLTLGGFTLEADFMNRAAKGQPFWFRDCSVVGLLTYQPSTRFNLFGKITYDVNRTDISADYSVRPGTELTQVGAGIEYRPLPNVRLHAAYARSFGSNGSEQPVARPQTDKISVGLMWNLNLLSLKNLWKKKAADAAS